MSGLNALEPEGAGKSFTDAVRASFQRYLLNHFNLIE